MERGALGPTQHMTFVYISMHLPMKWKRGWVGPFTISKVIPLLPISWIFPQASSSIQHFMLAI